MLEIQTFGTVGLRSRADGASEANIVQPKRLALLVYLATAPPRRCRRRDQIVSLFWPELDREHARGSLSQGLRYLRKTLGAGAIISQGEEEVGVDRELIRCDAFDFGALVEQGRREEAVQLYRGPFLDGFFVADAGPDYEHWVADERARFRSEAAGAAAMLADAAEQRGDHPVAIRWARQATMITPEDEPATARLVRILDQSGDRAGALRVYEALRQRLLDEFQVAPSRETQAVITRILAR
jgi:serine/threonine-protein kinase